MGIACWCRRYARMYLERRRRSRQERSRMLCLSRKPNESIVVNDNITITVIEVRGNKVRLGVTAPKEVSVHREEVWLAIQKGQQPEAEQPGAA